MFFLFENVKIIPFLKAYKKFLSSCNWEILEKSYTAAANIKIRIVTAAQIIKKKGTMDSLIFKIPGFQNKTMEVTGMIKAIVQLRQFAKNIFNIERKLSAEEKRRLVKLAFLSSMATEYIPPAKKIETRKKRIVNKKRIEKKSGRLPL
jgi:hypothetical protein